MPDYALEGFKWGSPAFGTAGGDVTWSFATTNYPSQQYPYSGFLAGEYQHEVELAFARWQAFANIDFDEQPDGAGNDIRLGFKQFDGSGGLAGITYISNNNGTYSSNIYFDQDENYHIGADGMLIDNSGNRFYSVALHEIGHSLGLDHYNAAPAIMNAVGSSSITDLLQPDIDGIQAIYGARAAPAFTGPATVGTYQTNGAIGSNWSVAGVGNLTGVAGTGDVVWTLNGSVSVWHLSGGQLTSAAMSNGRIGSEWTPAGLGDFNGDGRSDILWVNGAGSASVWTMNGASVAAAGQVQGQMGSDWHVKAIADVTGDGKADAIWVDPHNQVDVWEMSGSTLAAAPLSDGHMGTEWSLMGAGDLNGDTKSDLVWERSDGALAIWFMSGAHVSSVATLAGMTDGSHVAAVKDFNKDGFADLLWENGAGQSSIWLMQGATVKSVDPLASTPGAPYVFAGAQDVTSQGVPDLLYAANGHIGVQNLA